MARPVALLATWWQVSLQLLSFARRLSEIHSIVHLWFTWRCAATSTHGLFYCICNSRPRVKISSLYKNRLHFLFLWKMPQQKHKHIMLREITCSLLPITRVTLCFTYKWHKPPFIVLFSCRLQHNNRVNNKHGCAGTLGHASPRLTCVWKEVLVPKKGFLKSCLVVFFQD